MLLHYCPCQEARPSLTDTDIERGLKKRQMDEMRRDNIQQKGYKIVEMWEREWWWSLSKSDESVKSHLQEIFPHRRPLSEEQLWQDLSMDHSLVFFNVILKCVNTCATIFPPFPPYSKILL